MTTAFRRSSCCADASGLLVLFASDLIELNGKDLRRQAIEARRASLAKLLFATRSGIQYSEHVELPADLKAADRATGSSSRIRRAPPPSARPKRIGIERGLVSPPMPRPSLAEQHVGV